LGVNARDPKVNVDANIFESMNEFKEKKKKKKKKKTRKSPIRSNQNQSKTKQIKNQERMKDGKKELPI
jgi:hypothetical protein